MSLPPVISQLQAIQWRASDIEAPACANAYRSQQLAAYGIGVDAYLLFLQNADDETVDSRFAAYRNSASVADSLLITLLKQATTP